MSKMKKIFLLVLLCVSIFSTKVFASQSNHIEGEEFFNETADKITKGELTLKPVEVINGFLDQLLVEIRKSRKEMVSLLVIALLSGILQAIRGKEEQDGIGEAGILACFVMMTISALEIFKTTVGYGSDVVGDLTDFVTKLSPVFAVLLVSGGAVSSASAFHPILSGAVYLMTVICDKVVIPLMYFSTALGVVGNITPRLKISRFTGIIRSVAKWILLSCLTVFSGITAIYGFSAPVFDAVALRSVKFAVGSFVPVVGGLLSETVETVLTGTKLMKNSVGVAGIITIIVICFVPVLKIFAIKIMLELCAGAVEPLADNRITEMLKDISASISLMISMVITVSMLFIICIGIILGATG